MRPSSRSSPDGPFHYVPFLTLRDSQAADKPYLVQNYGVALAPALRLISSRAASATSVLDRLTHAAGSRSGVPRG